MRKKEVKLAKIRENSDLFERRKEKRGHLWRKKSVGKTKKHKSFYTRKSVVENVCYTNNYMQNGVSFSLLQDYEDTLPTYSVPIIASRMNPFKKRENDENQWVSLKNPLEVTIEPIIKSKTRRSNRSLLGWFKMFGLRSCKYTKLYLCVLFWSYLKLQVKFCCDFYWDKN
jgi:hypothetical protein